MYATLSLILTLLPLAANGEGAFSYDVTADDGPNNWANLDIEMNQCGGMRQSGINVPSGPCDKMQADYILEPGTCTESDLTFTINDHVIQLSFDTSISNCTPPSMVIPNIDTVFDVLQYHIHAGSDHSLDNRYFGADLHIVHKDRNSADLQLSVLGMFIEATSPDVTGHFDVLIKGLQAVNEATQTKCGSVESNSTTGGNAGGNSGANATDGNSTAVETAGARRSLQDIYNPYAKLPANATMYNYLGSLTTPPCSEIVTWNVVDMPVSISVQEYATLIDLILGFVDPVACVPKSVFSPAGYTSRPVQPLNGRNITHFCPTGTEGRFETSMIGSAAAAVTTPVMASLAFAMTIIAVAMF